MTAEAEFSSTLLLRLKSETTWLRLWLAGQRLQNLLRKANFDPNQPRVPRGNPDGGQWTRVDGGGNPAKPSRPPARVPSIRIDDGEGSALEIPEGRPPSSTVFFYVKRIAKWAVRAAFRNSPVGRVMKVIDAARWVYDYYPYIDAYLDEPKSLAELQANVSKPAKGYDIHHIVEKAPARNDGYPAAMTEAPENLVRIPTLKHWEITSWYMKQNDNFGGLTPRKYLRGKS